MTWWITEVRAWILGKSAILYIYWGIILDSISAHDPILSSFLKRKWYWTGLSKSQSYLQQREFFLGWTSRRLTLSSLPGRSTTWLPFFRAVVEVGGEDLMGSEDWFRCTSSTTRATTAPTPSWLLPWGTCVRVLVRAALRRCLRITSLFKRLNQQIGGETGAATTVMVKESTSCDTL